VLYTVGMLWCSLLSAFFHPRRHSLLDRVVQYVYKQPLPSAAPYICYPFGHRPGTAFKDADRSLAAPRDAYVGIGPPLRGDSPDGEN